MLYAPRKNAGCIYVRPHFWFIWSSRRKLNPERPFLGFESGFMYSVSSMKVPPICWQHCSTVFLHAGPPEANVT